MAQIDLPYLCTTIGNLSGIPVRIFEGENLTFYYSQVYLPRDPMAIYRDQIFAVSSHVGYITTPHFHYYGIVNSGQIKIVIGPTRQITENDQELRELAFRADVTADDIEDFISPEYVLMFIPVESCYAMLFADNGELWELAWKNKIMPVSPSTLLAALKIINSFNMVSRQNKNAREIATLAGKMMDKFADMVKDLNGVQSNLTRAMTKLAGRDNLVRQCERLTELGAKSDKEIPEPVISELSEEVMIK